MVLRNIDGVRCTHLLKATASIHICIIYSAKHFALPQFRCGTLDFRFLHFHHTRSRQTDTSLDGEWRVGRERETGVQHLRIKSTCDSIIEFHRYWCAVCALRSLWFTFFDRWIFVEWQRTRSIIFFFTWDFGPKLSLTRPRLTLFALMYCHRF